AERLFIPWANGVLLNHDRFTPEEGGVTGATPEVLAGLFPLWYCTDPATERATIEFYLGRVGEFVGYPMLSALLGVYAAWIGDRERSLELFEQGYADFILEPFTETDEFSRKKFPEKPRVGPFQANLGGFLSACVYGLPGIRIVPADPAEWARRAAEGLAALGPSLRSADLGRRARSSRPNIQSQGESRARDDQGGGDQNGSDHIRSDAPRIADRAVGVRLRQ